jgi:hypothetical protein
MQFKQLSRPRFTPLPQSTLLQQQTAAAIVSQLLYLSRLQLCLRGGATPRSNLKLLGATSHYQHYPPQHDTVHLVHLGSAPRPARCGGAHWPRHREGPRPPKVLDLGYADDAGLCGSTPKELQKLIDCYCGDNGLIVNPTKCEAMVFNNCSACQAPVAWPWRWC